MLFLGNDPSRWRIDLPLYEGVRLVERLAWCRCRRRIEDGHFEYDVLVSPGADLGTFSVDVSGADGLRLELDGSLVIETPLGPVSQPPPKTWQVLEDGPREPVPCSYVVFSGKSFAFAAPDRDGRRPLVIDPGLIYSTLLGGGAGDKAQAVAVDTTGAAIVVWLTSSPGFPTAPFAFQPTYNGGSGINVIETRSSRS